MLSISRLAAFCTAALTFSACSSGTTAPIPGPPKTTLSVTTQRNAAQAALATEFGIGFLTLILGNGTSQASVSASKSGMFGITLRKSVSLNDPLVTSMRGYTVSDLSLPGILAHAQQVAGALSSASTTVNGKPVIAVTLNVANPLQDNGMTREVLYLAQATQLPVRVDGFAGRQLVRSYRFAITSTL